MSNMPAIMTDANPARRPSPPALADPPTTGSRAGAVVPSAERGDRASGDVGDGALLGALGELGVLRQHAGRVPRCRGTCPLGPAALQLGVVDDQVEAQRR